MQLRTLTPNPRPRRQSAELHSIGKAIVNQDDAFNKLEQKAFDDNSGSMNPRTVGRGPLVAFLDNSGSMKQNLAGTKECSKEHLVGIASGYHVENENADEILARLRVAKYALRTFARGHR